jgi:hypothetical protein
VELKPRFVFHANAAALGGRIVKPKDVVIETHAASSLAAVGGRSVSKAGSRKFGDVLSVASASTFAEGLFDDPAKWGETLCTHRSEDSHTASMRVSAEVRGFSVTADTTFTVKRVKGGFVAKSAQGGGEPTIALDEDTVVEGAAIGGYKLIVEVNKKLFQSVNTLSKLRTAADDPQFVRQHGAHLLMDRTVTGPMVASPAGRLVESAGKVYGTIIQSIRWANKPYPGAVIDCNAIKLPNCGEIYFGEIYISKHARRLTMLRLDFCCPHPMRLMASDSENNGTWDG